MVLTHFTPAIMELLSCIPSELSHDGILWWDCPMRHRSISIFKNYRNDIGPIEPGSWNEILQITPKLSVGKQHYLCHIYLLHRVYRTTLFLHKIDLRDYPIWDRCIMHPAALLHMMWHCPKIKPFKLFSVTFGCCWCYTLDMQTLLCWGPAYRDGRQNFIFGQFGDRATLAWWKPTYCARVFE